MNPDIKAVAEELSALDAALSGAVADLQTAQEETVRLTAQRENFEKNIAHAKQNQLLAEQELVSLTERVSRLQSGEATHAGLLDEMESQLAAFREQIEGVRTRRDALAIGAETTGTGIAEQRMAMMAAQKDLDALTLEMARIEEQIDTAGTRADRLREEKAALEAHNQALEAELAHLEQTKIQLTDSVAGHHADIAAILEQRAALEQETTALRAREREIAASREETSRELARLEERRHAVQAEYDGIITKLWEEYELPFSEAAKLAVPLPDRDKAARRLAELRGKIKALGTVNVDAIEEYAEVSERYRFLSGQVKDVEESKAQLLKLIGDLTEEMKDIFSDNFGKIAATFSKVFTQLFGGGRAELALTDREDVLESGVDIHVQPPGKVIKNLSLLSGGEQAFVAIAIYFAILIVKPAPFCIVDEIEAALDDVNVNKYAAYLRTLCDKTQFITITHRRGTMEEADVLYGVTMQEDGVSKLLELKVAEALSGNE
jgi:chromosome segregation protein